jgi:hypothetical protein
VFPFAVLFPGEPPAVCGFHLAHSSQRNVQQLQGDDLFQKFALDNTSVTSLETFPCSRFFSQDYYFRRMPDVSTHIYTGLPGNWMNWMLWCGSYLYSKQIKNIQHIQGDSSGNFYILGGESTG